jgi:hypothetical protein
MKSRFQVLLTLSALSTAAHADIVQSSGIFDRAISFYDPIGQTFTAVDAQINAIAFAFSDINPTFPNEPITMSLYEGVGFGGTLLGSVTQTLPGVLPGTLDTPVFIDFDFSGTALNVGSVYTVAVTVPSSPKVAVVYSDANPYAGGHYISGVDGIITGFDLNFRVTAVPAPSAAAMGGICLLVSARRRRN